MISLLINVFVPHCGALYGVRYFCHSVGIRPLYEGKTVKTRRIVDGFRQNDKSSVHRRAHRNMGSLQLGNASR